MRQFLSYLPPNVHEPSPVVQCDEPEVLPPARAARLRDIVPGNRRQTYRVREVLELIVDAGSFFEIGTTQYGASQVTGLARLGGRSVGVMANDNCVFGGAMTADGADKVSLRIPPLICGFFVATALRVFLLPPPPPRRKGIPPFV